MVVGTRELSPVNVVALGAGAVLVLYVMRNGAAGAAKGLAHGAVGIATDIAGGAVVGVLDGVSEAVGIPTPEETTTNPAVARYIIDHPQGGQVDASLWASATAYVKALFMDEGTGTPPPPNTKLAARFPPFDDGWN